MYKSCLYNINFSNFSVWCNNPSPTLFRLQSRLGTENFRRRWTLTRDLNRFQEMTATFLELLATPRTFLDCTGRPIQPGILTTSCGTDLAPATPITCRYIRRCDVFRSHAQSLRSSIPSTAELINYSALAQKFIYSLMWVKEKSVAFNFYQ